MSIYRILSLFILILSMNNTFLHAQKVVKTSGSAQAELRDDMSRQELYNFLREQATIDALEKAFGRVVIQGNATYISNEQTGQKIKTNTVFNTIANTYVKGELTDIIDERFTDIPGWKTIEGKKKKILEIKCDIKIHAREIVTPPIQFEAFPLACENMKCRTTEFNEGDRLYFYFKSPLSGYITIYLDDNKSSLCLLPHIYMTTDNETGVPVSADEEYVFFTDIEYILDAERKQDMNRLFIIYSKDPLLKPSLEQINEKDEDGFMFPASMPSEEFQKWLNTYRSMGKNRVQVSIVDITITR